MIRCLLKNSFNRFSKTCKKHFHEQMLVSYYQTNDYNLFYEFWEGRKFLGAMYGKDFYDSSNEIYIDHMFVNEKYRGKGYGRYMIDYLKNKYKYIYVESLYDSIDFYKAVGFKKKRDQSHRIYQNTLDMKLTVSRIKI